MKHSRYITLLLAATLLTSCEKIIEIDDPSDALSADLAFSSAEGIRAAATGLYTYNFLDNALIYQVQDLYYSFIADDLKARNASYSQYYESSYNPSTPYFNNFWQYAYKGIYQANDFIARTQDTNVLPDDERNQYIGEALWLRAYFYIILANSYGDVPLVVTNNAAATATLPRSPKAEVDAQIIDDLERSITYQSASKNPRTRITQDASIALLARAYLYQQQWQRALEQANRLIPSIHGGNGGSKYQLEKVDRVFLANSSEQILQDDMEGFVGSGTYVGYTRQAWNFVPTGSNAAYFLSDELVADFLSEPGDQRWTSWVGTLVNGSITYYYPYKYKNTTTPASSDDYEYLSLLRLSEQYLIRAEANAHLGNIAQAIADINIIRQRAGLQPIADNITQDDLLLRIETERRKEFFTEVGHRWFDLRRTGRLDAVMNATSYKQWAPHKNLFPVPQNELSKNSSLTQNPGY